MILRNKLLKKIQIILRKRRFSIFNWLISSLDRPISILDLGGTQKFWEEMEFIDNKEVYMTLLNVKKIEVKYKNYSSITGDATNLEQYKENQFDVVFSNSVIEHVGDETKQKLMAEEIKRVAKYYFVQTPSIRFPIEPHFRFLGFQYLPLMVKIFLIKHFNLGHYKKIEDTNRAKSLAQSINLLSYKQCKKLFPDAEIKKEKFIGLTKSYIIYKFK